MGVSRSRPAGIESGPGSAAEDTALGGPALFDLVRFWSRRWINQALLGTKDDDSTTRHIQHVQIVEAVASMIPDGGETSVGKLAEILSLDQSGASRMVSDAVAAGYLRRTESAHDRRRSVVELTPEGQSLHRRAIAWQQQTFADLTDTWSTRDRSQFAGYLHRLASEVLTADRSP